MTTDVMTTLPPYSRSGWGGAARRVLALSRAELLLLRKNPLALLVTAAMPVALVFLLRLSVPPEMAGLDLGAFVVTSLTGATLILVVYYNLVTALVSRREDLLLKRLRTGELSDGEIVAGMLAPAIVISWGQVLLGTVAAVAVFDLTMPVNPFLVLGAVVGGTVVFTLLALATSGLTRSVRSAELTTTPVLIASLTLSGLMIPVQFLPEPLTQIARVLPLTPVVELLRLGLTGTAGVGQTVGLLASFGPAVLPLVIMAAWIAAGLLLTRGWFRWEPRR
jgi:ABC-2 type transport system permease protein